MQSTVELSYHDRLDHIVDDIGFGWFHLMAMFGLGCRIIARGSIYSLTTVLEPYFQCKFQLSYFTTSFYITSFLACFTISTWPTGKMVDKFGKRKTLILLGVMSVIIAILHIISRSFLMITITLSAFGLVEGAGFFVYPYLLEILPKSKRKFIIIIEIFFVVGFITGVIMCKISLDYLSWQWSIVVCLIIPILVTIIVMIRSPESPRYLIAVNDNNGAIKALVQIALMNQPNLDRAELTKKYQEILLEDQPPEKDAAMIEVKGDEANHEKTYLVNNKNIQLSRKDIWQRIFLVSLLRFITEFCRSIVTFGAGQSYKNSSKSADQCRQCYMTFELEQLVSVSLGIAVAAFISYHLVGRLKRRLALQILTTILALIIIPFYFGISGWFLTGFFFLLSVTTGAYYMILFVYVSEVVPTSMRGLTVGLASGSSIAGLLFGAQFATYFLHLNVLICVVVTHVLVGVLMVTVYFFAVETRDMSLN